jgi:hypothetical protein
MIVMMVLLISARCGDSRDGVNRVRRQLLHRSGMFAAFPLFRRAKKPESLASCVVIVSNMDHMLSDYCS